MFWLAMAAAAATQMSLPVSIDPKAPDLAAIFEADDFPYYQSQSGLAYSVQLRATVRPDGSVQECVAERSSSDPAMDVRTCSVFAKRAKLAPGRWMDGTPAFGIIRLPVLWITAADGPPDLDLVSRTFRTDLEISVNRLPGDEDEALIPLLLAVDETGRPVDCAINPPPRGSPFQPRSELVPLACQKAKSDLTMEPARDSAGKAVRSVQSASARLIADRE